MLSVNSPEVGDPELSASNTPVAHWRAASTKPYGFEDSPAPPQGFAALEDSKQLPKAVVELLPSEPCADALRSPNRKR